MIISDEEIDEMAAERDRNTRNSKYRTVWESDSGDSYSRLGVCGEVALREFFGVMEKPPRLRGGDGGVDLRTHLRDRQDKVRLVTIDVKCALNPTYLWVEPPKKEKGQTFCDVYVLAQYMKKTRRAKLIKWHWGDVVKAAPITEEGKKHHSIPQGQCLDIEELRSRYGRTVRLCECGDWGMHGMDGKFYCAEHKPMRLFRGGK